MGPPYRGGAGHRSAGGLRAQPRRIVFCGVPPRQSDGIVTCRALAGGRGRSCSKRGRARPHSICLREKSSKSTTSPPPTATLGTLVEGRSEEHKLVAAGVAKPGILAKAFEATDRLVVEIFEDIDRQSKNRGDLFDLRCSEELTRFHAQPGHARRTGSSSASAGR